MGYLPEAMKAYLLRLGWSHGDQEIFTEAEAISLFDVEGINKAPARPDLEKLGQINSHFMRLADDDRLFELLKPLLEAAPDYLLTGHSHQSHDFHVGVTRRINPGALFRAKVFTVAVLDLATDELELREVAR